MLRTVLASTMVFVVVLFWLSSNPAFSGSSEYKYITDSKNRRLGTVYVGVDGNYLGELAIYSETGHLLFVRCTTNERRMGQEFMRRNKHNCRGQRAIWPKDLVRFAKIQVKKVHLDGPPRTCGICQEFPFQMFELPDGVEVIPLRFENLLGENGPSMMPPGIPGMPRIDPGLPIPSPPFHDFDGSLDPTLRQPGWSDDEDGYPGGREMNLDGMNVPGGNLPGGGMSGGGIGR